MVSSESIRAHEKPFRDKIDKLENQLQKSKQREAVLLEALEFIAGYVNAMQACEKSQQALEKYREIEGSE